MGLVSSHTLHTVNYIEYIINRNTSNTGIKVMIHEIRKGLLDSSLLLAIIYTLGHIVIAMCVVTIVTNSSFWEAGLVALIEPCVNGVWFYILHRVWRSWNG